MKVCVLGDTHFGMRGDSKVFHDLYRKFYQNTFLPYLKEHNIQAVIQLGDLFDRRKYINFQTLQSAKDYFFDPLAQSGITLHTLIGNHDIFYKNTLSVNSTELVLGEYSNIVIHVKPNTLEFDGVKVDLIPWLCDDNREEIKRFVSDTKSDFCFGHFELSGFEMDRGNFCHEGDNPDMLSRYEMVMTGHFHHPSKMKNIVYVGSPGEMTWADYNDKRGFHIFDTETRELTFIQNHYTIFEKIHYSDEDFYYDDVKTFDYSKYAGKYIKLIVVSKNNTFVFETFLDNLMKAGPADLSIVEDFTEKTAEEENEIDQADDTLTILDKYIDGVEFQFELSKPRLKSILRDIYTEALSVSP